MKAHAKGLNRVLSLVLIAVLLIGSVPLAHGASDVWNGSIAAGFDSGAGTKTDPYIIKTGAQLAYLAQSTNAGTTYKGKYFKLANDITLNTADMFARDEDGTITGAVDGKKPNTWTPIGIYTLSSNCQPFSGIFDGDGHKIIGIYIHSENDYQGLFGYCEKATVKNIGIVDGYVKGVESVGGVCGASFNGTIVGCYNTGTVSCSWGNSGGVCGNSASYIADCYNTGAVTSYGRCVGGVCGDNGGTIAGCYNTGAVTGSSYVGGVCGASGYSDILGSYNTGVVSGSECVGGVCGSNNDTTISNCYNTGAVIGDERVGGVCGDYVELYSSGSIVGCYNTGAVTGSSYVGSVTGMNYALFATSSPFGSYRTNVTIKNCYYLSDTATVAFNNAGDGTFTIDNVTALSDAQMRSAENFIGFDFAFIWTIDPTNVAHPYPTLTGVTGFNDVPMERYYYKAVMWAATNGITNGVDVINFTPNNDCTRAQAVMFLWNAVGCPKVSADTVNPFVDVKQGRYYYDAVLWAISEGITDGVDATHFNPNGKLTRGTFVTLVHRAYKLTPGAAYEEVPAADKFTDVKPDKFYTEAVAWAVANGITEGVTDTTFEPNALCTRAQVVTFLQRAYDK